MTRYQEFTSTTDARAKEQALWNQYYLRECARRGLVAGVDSLDTFRGRRLSLAAAVTTTTGRVRVVAGVPLLEVFGTYREVLNLTETSTLVERTALTQTVQDALNAEDATLSQLERVR